MSIRLKLTLWYSMILAVFIIIMGTLAYFFFSNNLSRHLDESLQVKAQDVLEETRIVDSFPFPLQHIIFPNVNAFSSPGVYLQIVNNRGKVVRKSHNLGEETLPLGKFTWERVQTGKIALETLQVGIENFTKQQKVRVYSVPLIVNHSIVGLLQVGSSLASIEAALREFRNLLIIGTFITVFVAGTVGWFMAGKSLQPIHRVIRTQKQFVADASHELRTPLTSIRGNIDLLKRMELAKDEPSEEIVEDISEEVERISRLISDLLLLARADAGYKMEMQTVSLHAILGDAIKTAEFIPKEVDFRKPDLDRVRNIELEGNPDYLKQLFLILLENAFKYTEEGNVSLEVSVEEPERRAVVRIRDTGIGMDEKEREQIFERFYRADSVRTRTGTGLGLSMAKWIIEQHRGSIDVKSSPEEGTTFTVYFRL